MNLDVIGCYRPPSAKVESVDSLVKLMCGWGKNEMVLKGDLNWDWLSLNSEAIRGLCNILHLIIHAVTRLNPKDISKSTFIDVIPTNNLHKYLPVGIFC